MSLNEVIFLVNPVKVNETSIEIDPNGSFICSIDIDNENEKEYVYIIINYLSVDKCLKVLPV